MVHHRETLRRKHTASQTDAFQATRVQADDVPNRPIRRLLSTRFLLNSKAKEPLVVVAPHAR